MPVFPAQDAHARDFKLALVDPDSGAIVDVVDEAGAPIYPAEHELTKSIGATHVLQGIRRAVRSLDSEATPAPAPTLTPLPPSPALVPASALKITAKF